MLPEMRFVRIEVGIGLSDPVETLIVPKDVDLEKLYLDWVEDVKDSSVKKSLPNFQFISFINYLKCRNYESANKSFTSYSGGKDEGYEPD